MKILRFYKAIRPASGYHTDQPPNTSKHTAELFAEVRCSFQLVFDMLDSKVQHVFFSGPSSLTWSLLSWTRFELGPTGSCSTLSSWWPGRRMPPTITPEVTTLSVRKSLYCLLWILFYVLSLKKWSIGWEVFCRHVLFILLMAHKRPYVGDFGSVEFLCRIRVRRNEC